MASTARLGLYLPARSDYVNVTRDISENMQKIDDACGVEEITVTPVAGITIANGGVFKFGRLVVVELRLTVSNTFTGVKFIEGLPQTQFNQNVVTLSTNDIGINVFVDTDGAIMMSSDSTRSKSTLIFSGSYIAAAN